MLLHKVLILSLLLIYTSTSLSFFIPTRLKQPNIKALWGHQVVIETLDGAKHELNVEEYKTVLEAALDEGIELPHDCKLGTCLACAAKLVSGTVDQTGSTLDDSVIEQGYALTCCSYPRSDLVIRSIPEDELIDQQFAR